jgi:nitroreductase
MDCIDAIMTRRSIRKYTTEAVTDEQLETLLRAAMNAPSAGNQQPWRFVVTRDAGVLDELSRATPYSGMLASAPLGIIVCAATDGLRHPGNWINDCSAALENLLLAAHAIGLGGVWIAVHPVEERIADVRRIAGLPDDVMPMSMVSIGHPAEDKPSADRFAPEYVVEDRWPG